ncbi:hypothetical protein OCS_02754 [Ophiocordyceps sinensis CO18]|uniref:Uncharacterized protein n=1 Tax=Ophiocordyceps sinensis (strain Co18 / CGMCC 3.14243) TaxID=911162 RepID=T5A7S4_OPHSC|nr:hypothetical protein OCS_02754 [Ophiocordyceps sinensis CO18]
MAVHTHNLNVEAKPKAKAKPEAKPKEAKPNAKPNATNAKPKVRRKAPLWFKRQLELRVPITQLRCARARTSRIRADSEGINIDDFNRQVAQDMDFTYVEALDYIATLNHVEAQDFPVAAIFKPKLRIELVPPSASKTLETALTRLSEEQHMPSVMTHGRQYTTGGGLCAYFARGDSERNLKNDRRPRIWGARDVLLDGDAAFGCILVNEGPFPATPDKLLHCELYSALSLLRRRVDNLEDQGHPEETPHELAPPTVIVTVAEEWPTTPEDEDDIDLTVPEYEFVPPRLYVRTIRASFEDCPYPEDSDTDVVLKIEVGKILDVTEVRRVQEWTVEDRARWANKLGVIMRHVLDPRLGKAEATEEEMLELEKSAESQSESSETSTYVPSEDAKSSASESSASEPSSAWSSPKK